MLIGLLDLGGFYVKVQLNLDEQNKEMTMETDMKFLLKSRLPDEKLINIFSECEVVIGGVTYSCFLLHFINCITAYSRTKEVKVEVKRVRLKVPELLWMDECLLIAKKYSKRILMLEQPFQFQDKKHHKIIYESQNIIQNIVIDNDFDTYKIYIVDENKVLKEGELKEIERDRKEVVKGKLKIIFRSRDIERILCRQRLH